MLIHFLKKIHSDTIKKRDEENIYTWQMYKVSSGKNDLGNGREIVQENGRNCEREKNILLISTVLTTLRNVTKSQE